MSRLLHGTIISGENNKACCVNTDAGRSDTAEMGCSDLALHIQIQRLHQSVLVGGDRI